MTKQVIGLGFSANDNTGDPLRTAFQKTNDNFTELYTAAATIIPQVQSSWTATSGLGAILNKPPIFSGIYNDLTSKPSLFSGAYNDLTGKPVIPSIGNINFFEGTINTTVSSNYLTLNNAISGPTANIRLPLTTEGSSGDIRVSNNGNLWKFKGNAALEFPDGSLQVTAWLTVQPNVQLNGPNTCRLSVNGNSTEIHAATTILLNPGVDTAVYVDSTASPTNIVATRGWIVDNINIYQNLQSGQADYTATIIDRNKHIYKTDGNGFGVLIPTNAQVPFPIGANFIIVSGTSDCPIRAVDDQVTQVFGAGFNQSNNWIFGPNNSGRILKIGTDKWILAANGLTIDV